MFILDKVSLPGWELRSEHIQHIRWMLEQHICNQCRWTKQDYDNHMTAFPEELEDEDFLREESADMVSKNINPLTFSEFFPETYKELSDMEKIDLLLDTACGCEFYFEETESESQTN